MQVTVLVRLILKTCSPDIQLHFGIKNSGTSYRCPTQLTDSLLYSSLLQMKGSELSQSVCRGRYPEYVCLVDSLVDESAFTSV